MKKNLIHFFSIGASIALLNLMGTSAMMPPTSASFLVEEVQGNKALIFNNDFGPFEISFLNCPELKQQTGQYVTAHFGKNTYFDDGDTITFSNGKSCTIQDVDSNFDEDRDLEGKYRGKSCEQAFGTGAYQSPYDNDKSCICKPGYHWNLWETKCIPNPTTATPPATTTNTAPAPQTNKMPAPQAISPTTPSTTTAAIDLIELELAKDALGAKNIAVLDGLAKKIKAAQPATQAKIKTLIENFTISNDLATRYIGIYLSLVLG